MGQFYEHIAISPKVHKEAKMAALMLELSIKKLTEKAIRDYIQKHKLDIGIARLDRKE